MKTYIYILIIFNCLFSVNSYSETLQSFAEFHTEWKKWSSLIGKDEFKLVQKKEIVEDKKECMHCPGYNKLTSAVNDILEKLVESGKADQLMLPVEVSKLKMKYYAELSKQNNQELKCKVIETLDYAILSDDRKLKGEAFLVAEEFISIEGFDNLTYLDPKTQKVSYYFQDDFEKDVLVQVVVEKGQPAKVLYYKYTPRTTEDKKIALPELNNETLAPNEVIDPTANIAGVELKYRPKIVKKGIVPDLKVGEAKVETEIVGGVIVDGNSKITLLEGGESNIGLKTNKYNLAKVKLKTNMKGETEHYLVVPYELPVKIIDTSVRGEVADNRNETVLSLNLISDDKVFLKASTSRNKSTGRESFFLSKEVSTGGNGTVVFSAGKQETGSHLASVKYVQKVNKSVVMSLDLKYDSEKRSSLYYTFTSYFK